MEALFIWATRFVAALTARQGIRRCIEMAEAAKAGVTCTGYAHVGLVLNGKRVYGTASDWEEQMSGDANRLVRPGAVAQRSAAQNGLRRVLPSCPMSLRCVLKMQRLSSNSGSART